MGNGWRSNRLLSPQTSSFDGFCSTRRLKTQIASPTGAELLLSASPSLAWSSPLFHSVSPSLFLVYFFPFAFFTFTFHLFVGFLFQKLHFKKKKTCRGNERLETSIFYEMIFLLLFSCRMRFTLLFDTVTDLELQKLMISFGFSNLLNLPSTVAHINTTLFWLTQIIFSSTSLVSILFFAFNPFAI